MTDPIHQTASMISQYWDATGYNVMYTHVRGIKAEPVMLGNTIDMVLPKEVRQKLIRATYFIAACSLTKTE